MARLWAFSPDTPENREPNRLMRSTPEADGRDRRRHQLGRLANGANGAHRHGWRRRSRDDQAVLGLDALDLAGDELLGRRPWSRRRAWRRPAPCIRPPPPAPAASVPSQLDQVLAGGRCRRWRLRTTWPLSSSTLTWTLGCRFRPAGSGCWRRRCCRGRSDRSRRSTSWPSMPMAEAVPLVWISLPSSASLVLVWIACSTEANCTSCEVKRVGIHRRQRILVLQLRGQQAGENCRNWRRGSGWRISPRRAAGADGTDCHGCLRVGSRLVRCQTWRSSSPRAADRSGFTCDARRSRRAGLAAPAPAARFAAVRHRHVAQREPEAALIDREAGGSRACRSRCGRRAAAAGGFPADRP